jgi:hypothetical protein
VTGFPQDGLVTITSGDHLERARIAEVDGDVPEVALVKWDRRQRRDLLARRRLGLGSRTRRGCRGCTLAVTVITMKMSMRAGDAVIVCDWRRKILVYAIVRVENGYGEHILVAHTDTERVRQILLRDEGRVWVRGHGDDAMAALLLARSA